jgi:hypothetical protein
MPAAKPYVDDALRGEASLTVGAALHQWHHRHIDAVVSVGPLECMPSKIAEAQWCHAAEREGIFCLSLAFNGDPVNPAALDNFAYEVKERFKARNSPARFDAAMPVAEECLPAAPRPVCALAGQPVVE